MEKLINDLYVFAVAIRMETARKFRVLLSSCASFLGKGDHHEA